MAPTGNRTKVGDVDLAEHTDTLNVTVPAADKIKPEQAAMAGKKYEKSFSFGQVETDEQANGVCTVKDWSLQDFVNEALKSAARSTTYQGELALYKVSEVSATDIQERMIRDYIRLGVKPEIARAQVESLLAAK